MGQMNLHFIPTLIVPCMHGSRKCCQRESKFDDVFLVDEKRKDSNTTISGPSSARQRNAIECWLGSCVISGDSDQYCYETLYFCVF